LTDGHAFGELALLNHKPRMATVRCLTKTHLMVLTKEAFDQVIAKIERRVMNERLNFFSELPIFQLLTKNQL
jgi:CRP-like cAMP-binding protein